VTSQKRRSKKLPFHKQGAYDSFDSLEEVPVHYKRARKLKFFILSKIGVQKDDPTCHFCKTKLSQKDNGANRCQFHPKKKIIIAFHYECSWQSLLNLIYKENP
jgi:hypothetical protein